MAKNRNPAAEDVASRAPLVDNSARAIGIGNNVNAGNPQSEAAWRGVAVSS